MEEEKSALAAMNQELTQRNQELEDALRNIHTIAEEVHEPKVAYSHNKQEMMEEVISNSRRNGSRILEIIDSLFQDF